MKELLKKETLEIEYGCKKEQERNQKIKKRILAQGKRVENLENYDENRGKLKEFRKETKFRYKFFDEKFFNGIDDMKELKCWKKN